MFKIFSWNVNGIRAVYSKNLPEWISSIDADVVCLQETKVDKSRMPTEIPETFHKAGFNDYWAYAKKAGYSGVCLLSKKEPKEVKTLGIPEFDDEGRYLEANFGDLVVISAYFPNSQEAGARLDYKLRFCDAILSRCQALSASNKHINLCGDYNIAHNEIDLARPSANIGNAGFLPEERQWMSTYLDSGYVDSFRYLFPEQKDAYSWWSYRMKARDKNIGWRLDYHCVDNALKNKIKSAKICNDILGSDHCPVYIELDI